MGCLFQTAKVQFDAPAGKERGYLLKGETTTPTQPESLFDDSKRFGFVTTIRENGTETNTRFHLGECIANHRSSLETSAVRPFCVLCSTAPGLCFCEVVVDVDGISVFAGQLRDEPLRFQLKGQRLGGIPHKKGDLPEVDEEMACITLQTHFPGLLQALRELLYSIMVPSESREDRPISIAELDHKVGEIVLLGNLVAMLEFFHGIVILTEVVETEAREVPGQALPVWTLCITGFRVDLVCHDFRRAGVPVRQCKSLVILPLQFALERILQAASVTFYTLTHIRFHHSSISRFLNQSAAECGSPSSRERQRRKVSAGPEDTENLRCLGSRRFNSAQEQETPFR